MTAESRAAAQRAAEGLATAQRFSVDGQEVPLTEELRSGLGALLRHLAAGDEVDVVAVPELLTTQQAADRLRVSRPTVVKMLDDGLIPYTRPGVHRRIARRALEEFIDSLEQRRRAGLDQLADSVDPDVPDRIVTTR